VHSGNGHLYFGMVGGLLVPCYVAFRRYRVDWSWYRGVARVAKIQDGGRSVNNLSFECGLSAFYALWRRGKTPKCCVGLFTSYGSLVINRNESISDVPNDLLITKIKASSPNDERTKHGAGEPGLLLHNIILYPLLLSPFELEFIRAGLTNCYMTSQSVQPLLV